MNTWKHKEADTFQGTWLIVAILSDAEIVQIIMSNPGKYGDISSWYKVQYKGGKA